MVAGKRKVIITCVVNGASHVASTAARAASAPEEIAEQAIEAARAGAAILHLPVPALSEGVREGRRPSLDRLLPRVAAETGAIIALGAGGGLTGPLATQFAHPHEAGPELLTVRVASTGVLPPAAGRTARRLSGALAGGGRAASASGDDGLAGLRSVVAPFADAPGTRFSFECDGVGHLHAVRRLVDEGLVKGPVFLQYGLGAWRGTGADPEILSRLRAAADRLFGRENHEFSVFGAGRQQMAVVTLGAILGGHVRVGHEDGPHLSRGPSAMSCSAQVLKVRRILDELSISIASAAEAREILWTRGAVGVNLDD